MSYASGRHLLQISGPTNIPHRVLTAIAKPTIDHRGPDFARLTSEVSEGLKEIFQTSSPVVIFPASGTGAWEAALVNTLSPGDKVLMFETGHFATLWSELARRIGLNVELVAGDWRSGADPVLVEEVLSQDNARKFKAVAVVHNETSTGVTSQIAEIRKAMDRTGHPALLLVDTISSLASIDYRHDEWGVDVTVAGSQKGLMLPPGLSFNAISEKALAASRKAGMPRAYWEWEPMLTNNRNGFFPYTPATNMMFGLREALEMLREEGLENVFTRHDRHAESTRRAIRTWGLEILCENPLEYSSTLTAILMPTGYCGDEFRRVVLENFNMSLGNGLGKLKGRVFRIGHLGDLNDIAVAGALAGVEMGLAVAGVPHRKGGTTTAMEYMAASAGVRRLAQAAVN